MLFRSQLESCCCAVCWPISNRQSHRLQLPRGVGRAIGEAMAILLVAGNAVSLPLPFNSVRFLTTAIVSEMGYASGTHRQVLFTIGLVLFIFIMVINLVLTYVLKRGDLDE